jgi:peptidyl-prolyl cis-trans isomerase A (cyclophilin A)
MAKYDRRRVSRQSAASRKRPASARTVESLEERTFLNATILHAIDPISGSPEGSTTISLSSTFSDPNVTGPVVLMQTSKGDIPITLFDSQVHNTVQNFLYYVDHNEYNNTFIHRVVTVASGGIGIVQGGGYTTDLNTIPTIAPINLQYDLPNTQGTIAMARTGDPNSAKSEWFFNAADNSQSLGQSNGGGYAVFGQVLYNGMQAVNAIYNLPTGGSFATSDGGTQAEVPLQNYSGGTATTSNLVVVQNASEVSPLTYTVVSDDPSIVNPSISGDALQLAYVTDGTTNVTVTATDWGGNAVAVTFPVTISGVPNTAATIGKGQARIVRFTDLNGVASTATLAGPGTAKFTFNGSGIATSTSKGGVETVTGTPTSIAVSTSGTTAASTLTITGAPTIAGLTSDGDLGAVNASRATLNGSLTVPGSISRVVLGAASGGTISVGGSGRSLALSVGTASSEAVSSAEAISSLTGTSWTTVSELGSPSTISAPSIGRLSVKQAMNANVSTGKLGQATVGSITPSSWSVTGAVGGITAGSIMGLNLSAGSIGRIADRGDAVNSVVNSAGNIGAVSALGITGSRFYAGGPTNDGNGIPTAFPTAATINSVIVGRDGFGNSVIGAAALGRVSLNAVGSINAGTPFGVAAHTISFLSATVDGKRFSATRVTSADQVAAALTKTGITSNDLVIRIV